MNKILVCCFGILAISGFHEANAMQEETNALRRSEAQARASIHEPESMKCYTQMNESLNVVFDFGAQIEEVMMDSTKSEEEKQEELYKLNQTRHNAWLNARKDITSWLKSRQAEIDKIESSKKAGLIVGSQEVQPSLDYEVPAATEEVLSSLCTELKKK